MESSKHRVAAPVSRSATASCPGQDLRPRKVVVPNEQKIGRMSQEDVRNVRAQLMRDLGVVGGIGRVTEDCDTNSAECAIRDVAVLSTVARLRNQMWHRATPRAVPDPLSKLSESLAAPKR